MVEEVQDAHDDLIVGFRLYPPLPLHPEVRLHLRRRYRADIGIFRLLDIIQEASQVDEFPPDHADRQVGDTKPIPDISFEKFPVPAVRHFDKGDA